MYEVKDAVRSITINGKDLKATHLRAVRQGKVGCWLVIFEELGIDAEIRITSRKINRTE